MSHEAPLVIPIQHTLVEVVMPPVDEVPLLPPSVATPNTEQLRATEAAFTKDDQDSHAVAGLLGLWTGTLLLHDLAREHFDTPADEDDDRPRVEDRSHP